MDGCKAVALELESEMNGCKAVALELDCCLVFVLFGCWLCCGAERDCRWNRSTVVVGGAVLAFRPPFFPTPLLLSHVINEVRFIC